MQVIGYVVEQFLNGSEDERVARQRARRRRTARKEQKALRHEARESATRPAAGVSPLPVATRVLGGAVRGSSARPAPRGT